MTMTVRQIRADIRTARLSRRTEQARRERNDNIYMVLLGIAIYGGVLVQAVQRLLHFPPVGPTPPYLPPAQWLVAGCAALALGLLIRGLLVLGPLIAGTPFQFWLLSTPVDRKALLSRRFWLTVSLATVAGAMLGLALSALLQSGPTGRFLSTVTGAALAASVLAVGVLLQAKADSGRWLTNVLVAVGVLTVAAATVLTVPVIDLPLAEVVIAVLPVIASVQAFAALTRLDRVALSAGTEILTATRTAVIWLDIRMFSGIAATRKWRRIGRVKSRPLRWTRYGAMLSAELTRLLRNRKAILVWAGLLLAPYAAARVLPSLFVSLVDLVMCTVAISPFASGLRSVGRSPALRRSLGGTDVKIRLIHLVLPSVMAVGWTVFAAPATGFTYALIIVPLGAVGFAYRRATQAPLDYSGPSVDTPFGLIQPDMLRQMTRGPFLLFVLASVQLNL